MANQARVGRSKELTFNTLVKQLETPGSLLNLLTEEMRMAALQVPDEYIDISEEDMLKFIKRRIKKIPTPIVEALRNNFWMEYDRISASRTEKVMNVSNIYLGVCGRDYFHKLINEEPEMFGYILIRPPEYEAIQAGLLSLATRRVREILSIPLKKKDGELQDAKIIELVLKAAAMVDLRNKGGYINRSETKNMTMIEQKTQHSYSGLFSSASSTVGTANEIQKSIDEQLKQLEAEMNATPKPPEPKFSDKSDVVDAEFKEVSSNE